MNKLENEILNYLHINPLQLDEYLKECSYEDLEDPHTFLNIEKAVERINLAINNNEKIMIYGDYDCDGISATAILVKMFEIKGIKVGYYIPSRYIDGYGITLNRAKQIHEKGYKLVITVDNGITCNEAIEYLQTNGVDVILTDHHALIDDLPKSYAIVHPFLKKNNMVLPECGAYVAFMISILVLNYADEYLLCLASQATISDMMPLISYNRNLVKLSFKILKKHPEYPFFKIQSDMEINEDAFNYFICPKINSIGRVKEDTSINKLVELFVSKDENQISKLVEFLEINNSLRKSMVMDLVSSINVNEYKNDKVIIEVFNTKEGLLGLIANRLFTELKKPAFVFMYSPKDGTYKGSARSYESFPLDYIFNELSNYLLKYGGHSRAGGLTVEKDKFNDFVLALKHLANKEKIEPKNDRYILVNNEDLTFEIYEFLQKLGPYGQDYEKVNFAIKIDPKSAYFIGNKKQHIKGRINKNCSYLGWNRASKIKNEPIMLIGNLEYDNYSKKNNVSLKVSKVISGNEL